MKFNRIILHYLEGYRDSFFRCSTIEFVLMFYGIENIFDILIEFNDFEIHFSIVIQYSQVNGGSQMLAKPFGQNRYHGIKLWYACSFIKMKAGLSLHILLLIPLCCWAT